MTTYSPRIAEVLDRLGYLGEPGTVTEDESEPGARDLVWRDVRDRCQVQAAFFRGAVPLVAFLETTSPSDAARAQQRLWNFGRIPILIAASADEVRAMSCAQYPSPEDPDATTLAIHRGFGDITTLNAFHRLSVERGKPVEQFTRQLGSGNRVNSRLLRNLRDLQGRLISVGLGEHETERLIGRSLFVRFLEDRGILTESQLGSISPFGSFLDLLRSTPAHLTSVFDQLADRFNGDAFSPPIGDRALGRPAMDAVADFLSGGVVATGQQSFVPYDFSVIPTDLVSSLYEQLLQEDRRKTAAFYTPRRLVDLVLDEVLPVQGGSTPTSVMDPACGSGVFLSEAFKRLVYRESLEHELTYDDLCELLVGSIFGIDISQTAIGVASFGLDLALLEHVDPPTAWEEARLPTLVGNNLIAADFFEPNSLDPRQFDLIVGNPPWKSSLTPAARDYVSKHDPPVAVPDNQIAIAFLWRVTERLTDTGSFGLVLPSKPLLHNRTSQAREFRSQLYSRTTLETIFDLSPLRGQLFGSASAPSAVVTGSSGPPDSAAPNVLFLSPRQSPLSHMADGLVFSTEDIHVVPLPLAELSPEIWKTLLWGTYSDAEFLQSLRDRFDTLKTLAERHSWNVGQGFQIKGGAENPAEHLAGLSVIPVEAVDALHLSELHRRQITETVMHRPRRREIYLAPHVLLRKGFGTVPVSAFANFDAAHPDSLFGLAGPTEDTDLLRCVAAVLNSSLAHYYYFMTSSSWGVEREQLQLAEYLTLPFADPIPDKIRIGLLEVEQIAAGGADAGEWQERLDRLVFDAYGLDSAQRDLVLESLRLRMSQYSNPGASAAFDSVSDDDLRPYCVALAETISLYSRSLSVEAWPTVNPTGLVAITCSLDGDGARDGPSASDVLAALDESPGLPLEPRQEYASIIEPAALVLSGRFVHIVKPDEKRFWSKSGARDDARAVLAAVLSSQ